MTLVERAIEGSKDCTETDKCLSDLAIEFYRVHSDIIDLLPFENIGKVQPLELKQLNERGIVKC